MPAPPNVRLRGLSAPDRAHPIPNHSLARYRGCDLSFGSRPSEPPIGIEPMTYALRGGFKLSRAVQQVTPSLVAVLPVPLLSMVIRAVVSKCVSTIGHEG